ncbi:hypothetical protein BU15DRAFT_69369 [Melanogaster broomeanus]|nr:hypothetical protein BU15DRAFT_69369 [Melanogaster broomeanus]
MATTERRTVVIPIDLGPASKFDREIFPFSTYKGRDSLGRGDFLLEATLDELKKIKTMGTDLSRDQDFFTTTKTKYDELMEKREKIEQRPKSFNPFKLFTNYRAIRLFYASTKSLYLETRSTSEKMRRKFSRNLLSVPSDEVTHLGDGALPRGANVAGIAISLDGPLDDDAERTITTAAETITSCLGDPFADNPFITQLTSVAESMFSNSDAASVAAVDAAASATGAANRTSTASTRSQSSTSSGSTHNWLIVNNSMVASHSTVTAPTLNQNSSQASGSAAANRYEVPSQTPSVS